MPRPDSIVPLVISITLWFLAGCADRLAKTQGAWPLTVYATEGGVREYLDPMVRVPKPDTDGTIGTVTEPLLQAVYFDKMGKLAKSKKDRVYIAFDREVLMRDSSLGVNSTDHANNVAAELKRRRGLVAQRLLDAADHNGQEYWRRLSASMTYFQAVQDGTKTLMGAGIATTFISPIVGASIAGAGLVAEAVTDRLTADFDIDVYAALRESMEAKASSVRDEIEESLQKPYEKYKIHDLMRDVERYAFIFTVRGAAAASKEAASFTKALQDAAKAQGTRLQWSALDDRLLNEIKKGKGSRNMADGEVRVVPSEPTESSQETEPR